MAWHEDTVHHQSGGSAYIGSQDPTFTLHLSPGYVIIPQKMTLNSEFDWTSIGNSTENYPSQTYQWKNMQTFYAGLHLRYKLF